MKMSSPHGRRCRGPRVLPCHFHKSEVGNMKTIEHSPLMLCSIPYSAYCIPFDDAK
jgi:hypothetical protein